MSPQQGLPQGKNREKPALSPPAATGCHFPSPSQSSSGLTQPSFLHACFPTPQTSPGVGNLLTAAQDPGTAHDARPKTHGLSLVEMQRGLTGPTVAWKWSLSLGRGDEGPETVTHAWPLAPHGGRGRLLLAQGCRPRLAGRGVGNAGTGVSFFLSALGVS